MMALTRISVGITVGCAVVLFYLGIGRSERVIQKTDRVNALLWGAIAALVAFLLTFLFTGISKWLLKTGLHLGSAPRRAGYFLLLLPAMILAAALVGFLFALLSELIGSIKNIIGLKDAGWEELSRFILVTGLGIVVGSIPVLETYFMLLYSRLLDLKVQ